MWLLVELEGEIGLEIGLELMDLKSWMGGSG